MHRSILRSVPPARTPTWRSRRRTTARSGLANAVRALLSYSSSDTTANTAGCIARNSAGTPTVIWGDLPVVAGGGGGALAAYSMTTNNFNGAIVTAPAAGWIAAEVNAVRWRFGGSDNIASIPTIQELMLEVDWPPMTASIAWIGNT